MADRIQIDADTSSAISKLNALDQKVSQLGGNFASAFGNMNIAATALGATLLAIGQQTAAFADDITDLAAANQMAVGEVLALSSALAQSGGSADSAGKLLQSLSNKVAEAAEGNLKGLASFEKLGVSLQDLGSMSNTQIKDTLLKNIAAIEDPMQRNAKAVEIFGKSMLGVDVRKFAEDQAKNRDEMEKFAPALETAGAAFDNVGKIFLNMKIAFAEAFEPLFKIISELNPSIDAMSVAFRGAAAALAVITGAAVIRGLLAIRSAIVAITIAAAANPFVAIATGLLAVGTAAYTYFGLGKKGADAVTDSTTKAGAATQKTTRDISGAVDALKKQQDALGKIGIELQRNFDIALRKYEQDTKNLSLSEDQQAIEQAIAKVGEDGLAAKIKLQDAFNALSADDKGRKSTLDFYNNELLLIDQRTSKQKTSVADSIKGVQDQMAAYKDLQASATFVGSALAKLQEKAIGFIGDIAGLEAQIVLETKLSQIVGIRAALTGQLGKVSEDQKDKALSAISDITSGVGLLGKSYRDVNADIVAQFDALKANGQITEDTYKKLITQTELARGSITRVSEASEEYAQKTSDRQRSFAAGWSKAYNSYVEEATNSAKMVEGIFSRAASGLENYFVDALKGVNGSWKKFVASLVEDLARASIRQSIGALLGAINLPGTPKRGNVAGTLGEILGGNKARGDAPSNPVHVSVGGSSRGMTPGASSDGQGAKTSEDTTSIFEDIKTAISDFASNVGSFLSNMFSGLGNFISNFTSGLGSIISSIGGTLFDVIGSIGGTLFDVIGSLGSGLGDILGGLMGGGGGGGGILSTLFDIGMSLFGFANGGVIPNNKPVIVGERGPELLFGAGGMGVRSNEDSFGGGSTVVTYNINAVDALSFKQMLAQDPTFLYAVTQQGAKGMPVRR